MKIQAIVLAHLHTETLLRWPEQHRQWFDAIDLTVDPVIGMHGGAVGMVYDAVNFLDPRELLNKGFAHCYSKHVRADFDHVFCFSQDEVVVGRPDRFRKWMEENTDIDVASGAFATCINGWVQSKPEFGFHRNWNLRHSDMMLASTIHEEPISTVRGSIGNLVNRAAPYCVLHYEYGYADKSGLYALMRELTIENKSPVTPGLAYFMSRRYGADPQLRAEAERYKQQHGL